MAKIKLFGRDHRALDDLAGKIVDIAKTAGVKYSGPIPLPTKILRIPTRYSPCGDGSETWAKYEMRIHKRLVYVAADEKVLRMIMRLPIPEDVKIEIEVVGS